MTCISSIKSLILDLPPSCIEFCPVARDYFVVGTYYLEKSEEVEVEDELQDTANTADTTTEDEKKEEDDDEDEKESGNVGEKKNPQVRTGSLVLFKLEGDEM
jgi:diphthamide biosynthesis protein 7